MKKIDEILQQSLRIHQQLETSGTWRQTITDMVEKTVACLHSGGKVLFAGNGGSAADAQHLAAEFSGRFYFDRKPLFAEALHCNTSYLTAVANDYSFDEVYARMITGMGRPGDLFIGLSTSGNSRNLIRALEAAKLGGLVTCSFTGAGGGKMAGLSDYWLEVPSNDTPRVQEVHILFGHIYCELVEARMFPRGP